MRLHRFYINQGIQGTTIRIEDDAVVHQWRDVFRYITGGQVIVFNGDGVDYLCMITEISRRTAMLSVIERNPSVMPTRNIGLALSCIKKDLFELVIQKATELGVSHIYPIISERSEKKSLNMERAQRIAVEASEQSGRGDVPTLAEPLEMKEFLAGDTVSQYDRQVVFHLSGEAFGATKTKQGSVLLFVGPEGGFSDAEIGVFTERGFSIATLGDLTLRAETAGIVAVSLVQLA